MSREQAIAALAESSEGNVPVRYLPDFLEYLGISETEFFENLDLFTNKRLFQTDDKGQLIKDNMRNLTPLYRPM
jgi:hypothetical protein